MIHRPKRDCLYGLGICEICIGCPDTSKFESNKDETYSSSIPIELKYDGKVMGLDSDIYFDLIFDNELDKKFDSNFYIDQIMYINDQFYIKQGTYSLDRSLGKYGGYRILVNQ